MKSFILRSMSICCVLLLTSCAVPQTRLSEREIFLKAREDGEKKEAPLKYSLLSYPKAPRDEKFPLLIILHGQGQSGAPYLKTWEEEASKRRFIVFAPTWAGHLKSKTEASRLYPAIYEVLQTQPVDPERVYLAGLSAGGLIAQQLAYENPELWKGIVFIAYAPGARWLEKSPQNFKFPPVLFVHGEKDTQFKTSEVTSAVQAFSQKGIHCRVLSYPEAGHEHLPEWNKRIFDELEKLSEKS